MNDKTNKSNAHTQLVNAFRAYLQTVTTAEQFKVSERLRLLPGAKTVNYCAWLTEGGENSLARELAAPVCAILKEIEAAAIYYYRPLYQKALKEPEKKAEYENILWQLDFALALILRRFSSLIRFRSKSTKCSDLLCDTIMWMNCGTEAAKLVRRWQKEFPEDAQEEDGSPLPGSFPDYFALDTYARVEALDLLADEFPGHVRTAARQMHGWPMLVHRHTNNRKRFRQLAKHLELGVDYLLDASEGARFRPDTSLVRYLIPLIRKFDNVRLVVKEPFGKSIEEERKNLRSWLWDELDKCPSDEEINAAWPLKQLPQLTKANAHEWAEKVVVPYIMVTDASDWKNCELPAFQQIAKQRGVKSRATFKSRLLSAVSATLRRLARPE